MEITKIDFVLPEPPADADNATVASHWHSIAGECGTGMVEAAARCGDALCEQRELMRAHGTQGGTKFTEWLDSLPFARRQAYRYMKVAENWEEVVPRASQLPDGEPLSIRGALKLLAPQKPDEEDVFDEVTAGQKLNDYLRRTLNEWPDNSRPVAIQWMKQVIKEFST